MTNARRVLIRKLQDMGLAKRILPKPVPSIDVGLDFEDNEWSRSVCSLPL
jgi:hypothetical protein